MKKLSFTFKCGIWFTIPMLIGLSIFYVIPLALSLKFIFTDGGENSHLVGFENLTALFSNPAYILSVQNTLKFIAVSVPLLIIFSLIIACYLSTNFSVLLQNILLVPYIMPVAAALLGWNVLFGTSGFISFFVEKVFNVSINLYEDPQAFWLIVFFYLIKNIGYMAVILCGAIGCLPIECREAFLLESKSEFQYTIHIVVPMIMPVLFFVGILSVVNCFQVFREIYAIYEFNPPTSLYMLQNFMNNNFLKLNYTRLCAASFLVTAVISILVFFYLRYVRRSNDG